MLKQVISRAYLMVLAMAMVAAVVVAYYPSTSSANAPAPGGGTCCAYSSHCPGDQLCYAPSGGLLDCNPSERGYCK
jgi:hypothetical protein